MTLAERVEQLTKQHGSLRAAARAIEIDAGYLSRLASGEKAHPSDAYLRRMGLKRITDYVLRERQNG